ncbi:MAG: hypothetical protein J6S23_01650 [Clostridia bacterium]|nr:hypothetical protein [Clostridia bacterium]
MMEGLSAADVAAVTGNGGNGNNGMWDNGWWIIILLLALGGRGFGYGGGGGGVGTNAVCASPADVTTAVDRQTFISKLDNLTYGLADSTFALNNVINNGFSNMELNSCKCCCELSRLAERGFCDVGNAIHNSTRDIIDNANCNTRAILDFLVKDKIDTLKEENQTLRQNAYINATQDAQTAELIRRLGRDTPIPAYVVQPSQPVTFPVNCCGQATFANYGGGCGGYGFNG